MVKIEELKELLETIFGSELNLSDVSESSDLRKDIGMNSIHLLYMAMVIEEKYSIQFENSDFEKINTVSDVITIIKGKV